MLPFLNAKKIASVIVEQRGKRDLETSGGESEVSGNAIPAELKAAAQDMMRAIEAKEPLAFAQALKAAIECCSYDESMEPPEAC